MLSDFNTDSEVITDEMTMENTYSKMNKDCALIASLLADNKHSEAIEWVNNHYKTHPVWRMQERFPETYLLDGKCLLLKTVVESIETTIQVLITFLTFNTCVAVLMKLKASDEDINHLFHCFAAK